MHWFLTKGINPFLKVFDKVRDKGGDWRSKIVPVKGDIAEENLGLSDEDWEMLQESVEIVFHSAATVRFDEDLKWVLRIVILLTYIFTTYASGTCLVTAMN